MPFIIGVVDGQQEPVFISEPQDSILALNPLVYWQFNGAGPVVPNQGTMPSKDLTTTNLVFGNPPVSDVDDATSAGFNGTNGRGSAVDPVITGTMPTMSCGVWFKTTNTHTTYRVLVQQKDASGSGFRIWYYPAIDQVEFASWTGTGAQDSALFGYAQMPSIRTGELVLVGATLSSAGAFLYVNGVRTAFSASRLNTGQPWSTTPDVYVGGDHVPTATDFFVGDISDIFITDTEITADQWSALYEVGRSVSRPTYDDFDDAFSFDPTVDTTQPFVVTNASSETDELAELFGGGTAFTRSVWATCTPALSQTLEVSSSSVTAQHVIHVYSGTALDSLTLVDTVGSTSAPQLTNAKNISLTGGTTYYFRIGNYLDDTGTISLSVGPPPPPPANDNFVDAITIDTTTSGSITGTCVNSTGETGEPDNPLLPLPQYTKSVWYKFTADATGTITFTNVGTDYLFMGIEAYTGAAVNALSSAGTTTYTAGTPYATSLPLSVTMGTEYFIQVICVDGSVQPDSFEFQWTDIT
jgi:hypothetical protein